MLIFNFNIDWKFICKSRKLSAHTPHTHVVLVESQNCACTESIWRMVGYTVHYWIWDLLIIRYLIYTATSPFETPELSLDMFGHLSPGQYAKSLLLKLVKVGNAIRIIGIDFCPMKENWTTIMFDKKEFGSRVLNSNVGNSNGTAQREVRQEHSSCWHRLCFGMDVIRTKFNGTPKPTKEPGYV